jgi:predicted adenylyl cyclase CyaB
MAPFARRSRLPHNVEIKAHVEDVAAFERRVAEFADGPPTTIEQCDTFLATSRGRLKLREFRDGSGELIYYERRDVAGPESSEYLIARTPDADALKGVLARALGVRGTVRKQRRLYMRGQTRIHVDCVEGLGNFMELEVVLNEFQTPADGRAIAEDLMKSLGVESHHLVEAAYVDLLAQRAESEEGNKP